VDANESRFHLLLTREDWGRCQLDGVALTDRWQSSPAEDAATPVKWNDAAQELTLRPRLFRFLAARRDAPPRLSDRRGAAADRFGNFYWIDASARAVRVQSTGSAATTQFWPTADGAAPPRHGDFQGAPEPPAAPLPLAGLAVTEDHYLVVGVLQPAGVLVFDLFAGGPPSRLYWPAKVDFEPFDMAPRPGGGVWILDRTHRRYWALDRHMRVMRDEQDLKTLAEAAEDTFQPLGMGAPRATPKLTFPRGIDYDAASPVDVTDAIAIEALPDGSVLILDRDEVAGFSKVWRYRYKRQLGDPVSLEPVAGMIEEDERTGFRVLAHDFVRVAAGASAGELDQLLVASSEGNQAFALALRVDGAQLRLEPLAKYLPMRRFGAKGLLVSASNGYYDFADSWVPLVAQRRPRYAPQAMLETRAHPESDPRRNDLDSGEPDCVWHRLMLDACIPPETGVEIWSRAANERDTLLLTQWQREPRLYRRGDGSELPWPPARPTCNTVESTHTTYATWELLFQRARGRFLQLRLVVAGNEQATPKLRALRVWYPRFSYVERYLPAVYRDDPDSGDFLERFLANLEGFYTVLEDRIAGVQALFDWRSVPADTLDWLARWFDMLLDPAWDERRRRLFIHHAMRFFQYRGTIHGLRMALALALDASVEDCEFEVPASIPEARQRYRVIERYLTRRTPGIVLGDTTGNTGPRELKTAPRWTPQEGGARLTQRYVDYVTALTNKAPGATAFPLIPPARDEEAKSWSAFAQSALGFVPSVVDDRLAWQGFLSSIYGGDQSALNQAYGTAYGSFGDVPLPRDLPTNAQAQRDWSEYLELQQPTAVAHERGLWQDFVARRYRRIAALNVAYQTSWTSFEEVSQPDTLPRDGAPLADWYQYQATVLAMRRLAHRFRVLIPTPGPNTDLSQLNQQLDLARRVVDLEKPAHTVFDVGFYWALFRIGDARLGSDTLLDVGSRAPQLMPALVLGRNYIGESYLAPPPGHPGKERLTLECIPVTN